MPYGSIIVASEQGSSSMYCPKCGMEQISDNMRFCSRCGLPISGLAEWLAGSTLPVVPEEAVVKAPSPRRKGISRGAKLVFISVVLMPIFFGISILADNPIPLMFPFTILLTGLAVMLYSRLFFEETAPIKSQPTQPARLGAMSDSNALPPASNIGISHIGGRPVRTAELAQPPSVTEHTTKLLDRD